MTDALVDGVVRETLTAGNPDTIIDGVVRESLVGVVTAAVVDGAVRETLVLGELPIPPIWDSYPIFPTLNSFPVHKRPTFATLVQTPINGREVTRYQQTSPLWEFELVFEILRDQSQNISPFSTTRGFTDLQRVMSFFLTTNSQYGYFFYDDPTDNSRSAQAIGTGDGSTRAFRVVRTWGSGSLGTAQGVGGVNTSEDIQVYIDGSPVPDTDWNISADKTSLVFVTAPGVGEVITMDFSFFYLVRFLDDSMHAEQFMTGRWSVQGFKFRQVWQTDVPSLVI